MRENFAFPRPDASKEVNNSVIQLINKRHLKLGLKPLTSVAEITPKEYSEQFFNVMRSFEPNAATIHEEVTQIIKTTKLDDLKKIEQIARERQIVRYERLQKTISDLKKSGGEGNLARASKIQKILDHDKIALGNGPHVSEVIHHIHDNRASITAVLKKIHAYSDQEIDHYLQYLDTLAAVHDLGKTFPDHFIAEIANHITAQGGNVFLTNRVAFHEFSSSIELEAIRMQYHIDIQTEHSLIRNILGHNDGSGLSDVFWNAVAFPEKLLGKYPLPEKLASKFLALADRGGQATLGVTGGVLKITQQELLHKSFGRALLVETMERNAKNTIRQMREISKSIGYEIEESPMVKDLIHAQQMTLDAFQDRKSVV